MGTLKKTFDPKKMATNFALRKMGLGWLNPFLGIGSFLLDKFAPGKKAALTEKFKAPKFTGSKYDKLNPNEMKNVRTRDDTPTRDGERVAEKTTVQEAIAGEKSLGIDFEDLRKKQMIMKNALDEGYYTDNEGKTIQLTDEQKTVITNYITQIDKYLVDPRAMAADGGRIDKALGGRSRDIG